MHRSKVAGRPILGLADVKILSSEIYLSSLTLYAVPKDVMQWGLHREKTHHARREEGVREMDFSRLM